MDLKLSIKQKSHLKINKKEKFSNLNFFVGRNENREDVEDSSKNKVEDELITKAARKLKEFSKVSIASKRNSLPAKISVAPSDVEDFEPLDESLLKDGNGM